ncbi:Membrane metallo-endopeptidase-like 1 [Mortierella alpina]|nr:Membrane metallo-endopeptidase-like 1 [Mortierella alpina]
MNKTSAIDKQALTKTLAYFSERGLDSLLSLRVVPSATDPQKNVHKSPETVGIEWLKNVTRNVDWPLLLPTIFAANSSRTVNVEIARDVAEGFDEMLQNHGSPLAVQGYFIWKAVKQLIGSIAPTCYRSLISVSSTEGERQKYCAEVLNSNLGRIAGHFFAKKTFSRDKQVAADEVARNVRQAVIKAYGSQGCLSKTELIHGLPSSNESVVFDEHHGIQDSSHASEELKSFYEDYRIGKKYFFRNRMRYAMWHRKNLFKDLADPSFMNALEELPQNVVLHRNARGRVKIPVGLLQPPFFKEKSPQYVYYGTIGTMIAREYSRDLDIKIGPLAGIGVSNECFRCFQCFMEQHFNFSLTKLHTPSNHGITTSWPLGQIIAEYIALKQAFQAWNASESSITDTLTCEKRRIESHSDTAFDSINTSPFLYINEALKNFQPFSEAFNCSVGVQMNP